jgi:hypothetical protein
MMCSSDLGILASYPSNSIAVVSFTVYSSSYSVGVFCACVKLMSKLEVEQHTIIKFLIKLGKMGTKIHEMLVQVYGDNAFKKQLFTSGVTGFLRVEKM